MGVGARALAAALAASAGSAALLGAAFQDATEPPVPDLPIHERFDLPSAAACGGCHVEVTREWSRSLHARAWTNANVRAATNEFSKKSCRPCHSPRSVFERGLAEAPPYRDFNQPDGVHCLSCHGLEDGVAAARTIEGAPCRPRFEPRLLSADLCFPCHEPTHQAFSEYRTSDAHDLGLRCVDCHMQPLARAGETAGRDHGPNGGLNPEFVRRAIRWEARREGTDVVLEVENRTGHKFPGEIPSRAFVVELVPAEGAPLTMLLRRPGKTEDRPDDRLLPDERRTLRFDDVGPGPARLRLLFRPLPLLPLEECFLLGEWTG